MITLKKAPTWFILGLFLLFYSLFYLQKIDLTRGDLGQHLKSGELFWKLGQPVSTNLYSYTAPDYPAVNHRWAAGALYFAIQEKFGFDGLSVFQIFLSVLTLLLLLLASLRKASLLTALFYSLLVIPLVTLRTEIRPDTLSFFLAALYFWLLTRSETAKTQKSLWLLPVIQMTWVNLHLFFFLGPILIFIFWLRARSKMLFLIFLASLLACLLNPYFLNGSISFASILAGKSYVGVTENRSSLEPGTFWDMYFHLLLALEALLITGALLKRRSENHFCSILCALLAGALGFNFIRAYPLFGYFLIPSAAGLTTDLTLSQPANIQKRIQLQLRLASGLLIGVALLFQGHFFSPWKGASGIGLLPDNERSARLFKQFGLRGPIYNNYDIGSFLIYELFPGERVFVDPRPEAYPLSFFKKIYTPIAASDRGWEAMNKRYGFNVIYSRYNLLNSPKNQFLIRRLNDPKWAVFYVDERVIILLKRGGVNDAVIRRLNL